METVKKIPLTLTIKERLQEIQSLFLLEANSDTLLLQRSIREKIEIDEEEAEEIGLKSELNETTNSVSFIWDDDKEKSLEPNFNVKELAYLDSRATALNNENKLKESNLDLALKIWEAVK